jgi:hypothetical protein
MSTRKAKAASPKNAVPKRRRHRARPTPRWLLRQVDLDEIAKRRCLLILSVLSGERPVTDVIEEGQISRPMYYQLEEKALRAMLSALVPGAEDGSSLAQSPARRIVELEKKVAELEKGKRRSERLLLLTRKIIKGPLKTAAGRKAKSVPSSTSAGHKRSRASKTKPMTQETGASPSMPAGEAAS